MWGTKIILKCMWTYYINKIFIYHNLIYIFIYITKKVFLDKKIVFINVFA